MSRFNHMFTIAFTLVNESKDGDGVSPAQFREAILKRMADLDASNQWDEAIGAPHDTYEEDSV